MPRTWASGFLINLKIRLGLASSRSDATVPSPGPFRSPVGVCNTGDGKHSNRHGD
jgi:hypothetical protein